MNQTPCQQLTEILERQANTIALGIMGNVPGAEGTPIYNNRRCTPLKAIRAVFKGLPAMQEESLDPSRLNGVSRFTSDGRDMWDEEYIEKVNMRINTRNNLRRQILSELESEK